jgi:uncharacterized protein YchJ
MSKLSRNDLCPCGSGLKYKKCCLNKKGIAKHKVNVMPSGAVSSQFSKLLGKKDPSDEQES